MGVEIVDTEVNRYLDASGGAALSCLGHGHPDLLAHARTALRTTEAAERLADRLVGDAPEGLDHVNLVSGLPEAIEAATQRAQNPFKAALSL